MQQTTHIKVLGLFNQFTEASCSGQSAQTQLSILIKIKRLVMSNPNNYFHPHYGKVSFINIYQFVIESLSRQQHQSVIIFLLHVLSLMTIFWVHTSDNLKKIYEGVLSLFQQRSFCGQNCFRYLYMLVETMQQHNSIFTRQISFIPEKNYSMMPAIRVSLQNYFVYHLLNQFLAFSNIFLDRSVVKNQQASILNNQQKHKGRKSQQNARFRYSHSFDKSNNLNMSNSHEMSSLEEPSEDCQLYKIQQDQSVIFSILALIRACLSYDFSHTSRYEQQSQYQPHKSPIILPTKYSKYCRFSQFDIFLKNQNTTEMVNYLFLVCSNPQLKLEVLKILQSMARIHFRYFKNKTFHKLHLEDVGYVVANLLTGLDLNQPQQISMKANTPPIDRHTKVEIAVGLGEIVNILLYHQPTFYITENSLIQMIIEHIQTFIIDQLLDPDYFDTEFENNCTDTIKNLSKIDLCLLIQTYMSLLPKLKDNFKNHSNSNETLNEKINQLYVKVGEKYFKVLIFSANESNHKSRQKTVQISKQYSLKKPIAEQSSKNSKKNQSQINSQNQIQSIGFNGTSLQQNNQQTETNILQENNYPKMLVKNQFQKEQEKSFSKKLLIQENNLCFLQSIVKQHGSIESIRNILSIFRVYCCQHSYFNQNEQDSKNKVNINMTNSDMSYFSQKSNQQNLTNNSFINKNFKKSNNQIWLTSWLCSFEHHFHVTAGHSRYCKNWEMELHTELMVQLIQDLYSGMQMYLSNFAIQFELGQCIQTILLYLVDKIVFDCRVGIQQYIDKIGFNLQYTCQFLINYLIQDMKQSKKLSEKLSIMPIIDFLNNLNFHSNIRSDLKKQQKDGNNYKEHVSFLSGKYKQMIYKFCKSFSDVKIISSHQYLISKVLHILLKIWIELAIMEESIELQSTHLNLITELFNHSPEVLYRLMEELSTHLHYKHRKDVQNLYLLIRNECLFLSSDNGYMCQKLVKMNKISVTQHNTLTHSTTLLIQAQRKLNQCKDNQRLLKISLAYLQISLQYMNTKQIKNNNCECINFLLSYTQLMLQILTLNKSVQYIHYLIGFKNHIDCLNYLQLTKAIIFLKYLISILGKIFNQSTFLQQCWSIYRQHNQKQSPKVLINSMIQICGWIFKILMNFKDKYNQQPCLLAVESEFIDFLTIGYLDSKSQYNSTPGILNIVSILVLNLSIQHKHLINQQNFIDAFLPSYIEKNIQYLLTQILHYLYSKCFEKTSDIMDSSYESYGLILQPCIKVDCIINIFTRYYNLIQSLYRHRPNLVEKVFSHEIVRDCVKYLHQMGVCWVVRKLQNWNSEQVQNLVQKSNQQAQYDHYQSPQQKNNYNLKQNKNDDIKQISQFDLIQSRTEIKNYGNTEQEIYNNANNNNNNERQPLNQQNNFFSKGNNQIYEQTKQVQKKQQILEHIKQSNCIKQQNVQTNQGNDININQKGSKQSSQTTTQIITQSQGKLQLGGYIEKDLQTQQKNPV